MMFHLNVVYDNDDMAQLTLVMTRVRMLRFIRHYKDTSLERLTILISFCSKFTGVQVCQKRRTRHIIVHFGDVSL